MTRPPLRREVAGLGEKNVACLHGFVAMPFNEDGQQGIEIDSIASMSN